MPRSDTIRRMKILTKTTDTSCIGFVFSGWHKNEARLARTSSSSRFLYCSNLFSLISPAKQMTAKTNNTPNIATKLQSPLWA